MNVTIFTAEVCPGDLADLRRRTRQIAGLLGFPVRHQAEISAAVALAADAAMGSAGPVEIDFQVAGARAAEIFRIYLHCGTAWQPDLLTGGGAEGDIPGSIRRLVDLFDVESTRGDRTNLVLEKSFPPGTPVPTGDALTRIAGELARRSHPRRTLIDIHGQNEELFDSVKDLTRLNRELEEYAHAVSHNEGVRMLAGAIKENVRRSASLIDDLQSLVDAGRVPARVSEVDVSAVVERVLGERALFIEERGVAAEVDEDLGRLVASPAHLYQLFAILVGNAVRNCRDGTGLVEIRMLGEDPGGGLAYLVRDDGPGIPPDEQEDIFVPFRKGRSGEMGTGLAIVEKIIKLYDGEIEAYNDGGACFRFVVRGLEGEPGRTEET